MFNFFRRKKSTDEMTSEFADKLAHKAVEHPSASEGEPKDTPVTATASVATHTESVIEAASEVATAPTDLGAIFARAMEAGLSEATTHTEPHTETQTEPETQTRPTMAGESQGGWFARLRKGLSKTGTNLRHVFVGVRVDEALFESLEDALLMADVGVNATQQVMNALRAWVKKEKIEDAQGVQTALKQILIELLQPLEKILDVESHHPLVLMVAGVNGAGKTTSIGKLTHHLQAMDKKIILAAGDTFRAAAREQLAVWGERNNVTVIAQESGDPAAVVFDAIASAQAKKLDVVIADTAGRLPTQLNLMDELKKVKRVADKAMSGAPHEIILVLDGNMGQNALAQVKAFDEAVGLTGLIITKLDGTAKGGVLAALAVERKIPVYFIGVGEGVHDLQTFDASEFVEALLGE
jgi:fused signal recognition particle receptor